MPHARKCARPPPGRDLAVNVGRVGYFSVIGGGSRHGLNSEALCEEPEYAVPNALWQRGRRMTEPSEHMTALMTPLNEDQRFFINCAWKPFLESQQWPIFDYIEAECDKQGIDARTSLASIPEFPLPGVSGFRYSLVWHNSTMPSADTPILLRVIGLHHLGEPFALEIANEFIRVLGYLIERRMSASYSPFKLNRVTVTSADISKKFPSMTPAIVKFLPNLLIHEPTTWQGTQQADTSGGWSIDIYRSILKFKGIRTLTEYLQRVDELLTPPEVVDSAPAIPSPFDLAASLDYFNAVWQLHFDRKKPIIRLSGAERTARLVYDVNTPEEFSAQVSCLTDILKNMQVSGDGKTPLIRLQTSLKSQLPEDSANRVDNAIDSLRHVTDVRNALFQHSGTEYRGVSALTQLGIEYPITDWQSTWVVVQRRAMDAVNALREEIQQFHEICDA